MSAIRVLLDSRATAPRYCAAGRERQPLSEDQTSPLPTQCVVTGSVLP